MVLVYPQMQKHATRFHRSHSLSWEPSSPTSAIPSLSRSTSKLSPYVTHTSVSPTHRIPNISPHHHVTSVSPTHRIPSPTVQLSIRPPLLRRSAVHIQSPTFTRVTRRRLSSPQHTTLSSPQPTTAPPPSPSPSSQLPPSPSPRPRRIPRRFTFAPIHVLTSRMRDTDVIDTETTDEPLTPAVDLVSWWSERETPVWKPPPSLHTVIEDEWEEQPTITSTTTTTTTSSSLPTTTTSSQSQTTPVRPPPILLPHTISSAPPFQFMPLTPTRSPSSILELSTPPTCVDVEAALISPSFAQLSMNPKYCDLMQPLSQGWEATSRLTPHQTSHFTPQEASRLTPVSWMNSTASWTPSHINDVTEEIGNWIGEMDTSS